MRQFFGFFFHTIMSRLYDFIDKLMALNNLFMLCKRSNYKLEWVMNILN
ncbi:hypothetical protein BFZC1_15950 [Lysinibacillus fusiformis ZC1]|nr:hypothetical protein BFZC1_15950 [Lysinibacillus fusiformis ZC1]